MQAGTTSKTFFPGVRLGWAAGPAEVAAQLVAAKQNTDQCAGALGQRLFEEYVRRGWIDEQLARSRTLYRRKCERMLSALERYMPADSRWTRAQGGFFSWLTLPGVRYEAICVLMSEEICATLTPSRAGSISFAIFLVAGSAHACLATAQLKLIFGNKPSLSSAGTCTASCRNCYGC